MSKLVAIGSTDPNGYARASFPQGVANPFVANVIPYPSNLHGSQWRYAREGNRFMPAVYNVLSGVGPTPEIVRVQEILIDLGLSALVPSLQKAYEQLEHCVPVLYGVYTRRLLLDLQATTQMTNPSAAAEQRVVAYIERCERTCYEALTLKKWVGVGTALGVAGGVGIYFYDKRRGGRAALRSVLYGTALGVSGGAIGGLLKLMAQRSAT